MSTIDTGSMKRNLSTATQSDKGSPPSHGKRERFFALLIRYTDQLVLHHTPSATLITMFILFVKNLAKNLETFCDEEIPGIPKGVPEICFYNSTMKIFVPSVGNLHPSKFQFTFWVLNPLVAKPGYSSGASAEGCAYSLHILDLTPPNQYFWW